MNHDVFIFSAVTEGDGVRISESLLSTSFQLRIYSEDVNKMECKVDEAVVAVADERGLREVIEGVLSQSEDSEDGVDINSKLFILNRARCRN